MAEPLRIQEFGGMIPRYHPRRLPPSAAEYAQNSDVERHTLRGLHLPTLEEQFAAGTLFAYKVPRVGTTPVWITSTTAGLHVVPGPVKQDAFNRYYISGDGAPKYTTQARLEAAQAPLDLGIPTPTEVMGLTPPTGVEETRSYVFTLVSIYGEESAPSPPVTDTGAISGTWALTNIGTAGGYPAHYDKKRIYRTVTGQVGAGFFYVDEIDISLNTYNDTALPEDVAFNEELESEDWAPPPATLQGFTEMPNGVIAAFDGKDIYFCEPYRPHAWPVKYILSVPYRIIAIAAVGTSLAIATEGHPSVATGIHPEGMTLTDFDFYEPCVANSNSIVSFGDFALYPSPNGLVGLYPHKAEIISRQIFTRDTWEAFFNPSMSAVRYRQDYYLAHLTGTVGFMLSLSEAQSAVSWVEFAAVPTSILSDPSTGEILVVYNGGVYNFNPPNSIRQNFTWRSKEFEVSQPMNFGALQVKYLETIDDISDILIDIQEYNTERIKKPLQPIGGHTIGAARRYDLSPYLPPLVPYFSQNKQPVGGTPLHDLAYLQNRVPSGIVKVYADGILRTTIDLREKGAEAIHRLPSGYKATYWQLEYMGNAEVVAIVMGVRPTDLKQA